MAPKTVKAAVGVSAALVIVALVVLAAPVVVTAATAATGAVANTVDFFATPSPTASGTPTEAVSPQPPSGPGLQTIDGQTFSAVGPGDCATNSEIYISQAQSGTGTAELLGELTDMGATTYASGTVRQNADGEIEAYTVQSGDTPAGIGERFCIDYITVLIYNHRVPPGTTIQPGDILVLRPDPDAPWSADEQYTAPQ